MDRKKSFHRAGTIALVTALVGLGTVTVGLLQQLGESRDRTRQEQAEKEKAQQELLLQSEQHKKFLEAQLAAQKAAAAAKAHADICAQHTDTRRAIEDRFSGLLQSHGTMLNAVRGCMGEKTEEDQNSCLAVVCIGGAFFTSGQSNCLTITADAAAIKEDYERARSSALADSCPVANSQITEFFKM